MRYRAVIFDIDGTLVPKELDAPTRRVTGAVRTLRESGCKVIIATGRSLAAAREVLGPVEADYFVTANGGRVTDEQGKCLYENPMTQEEMYALVDYCEDYEIPLLFVYPDDITATRNTRRTARPMHRRSPVCAFCSTARIRSVTWRGCRAEPAR